MNHLYFYHPEITTIGILLNFVSDRVVFKIICVHMQIIYMYTYYVYICIDTVRIIYIMHIQLYYILVLFFLLIL